MFRRNRNRLKPEISTTPSRDQTASTVGNVAVGNSMQPTQEAQPSYVDELRTRMLRIEAQQSAFLRKAIEQGATDEQLPQLIADAMNGGVFPRVIKGMAFRGSGFHINLIHGAVEPGALRATASISPPTESHPEGYLSYRLGFSDDMEMGTFKPAGDFKVEGSPRLPQGGDEPVDHEFLAKLDACIPPEIPQA